jgi:hypothetical protein
VPWLPRRGRDTLGGMRRRPLIVVVGAFAFVAVATAWWLGTGGPLTSEERQFVGTWKRQAGGTVTCTLDLSADRRWVERVVVAAGWGGMRGTDGSSGTGD